MPFPKNKFPQHTAVFPVRGKVELSRWTNFTITPTPFFISATAPSASPGQAKFCLWWATIRSSQVMQPEKIGTCISETSVLWIQDKQPSFHSPSLALRPTLALQYKGGQNCEVRMWGILRNRKKPQITAQLFFSPPCHQLEATFWTHSHVRAFERPVLICFGWRKEASKGEKRRRCRANPATPDWTAFVKKKIYNNK